jgi:lipopolysaccharide export system protein LptC
MKIPWPGCRTGSIFAKTFLLAATVVCVTISCENDIATIKALDEELNLPMQTGSNVEITYTDSGMVKVKLIAPELKRFSRDNDPYYEFPKGLKVLFYQGDGKVESHIQADYALFFEKQQLWEGRNNVVAKNERTHEQLYTEHIFWNQKEETIYSDQFTKIINADGTFYGEKGFEARQDLTKWKLKSSKGTVNVKDQQPEP